MIFKWQIGDEMCFFSLFVYKPVPQSAVDDKVDEVKSQVAEWTEVLTDTIDQVLQRGENLDNLLERTEELEADVSRGRIRLGMAEWFNEDCKPDIFTFIITPCNFERWIPMRYNIMIIILVFCFPEPTV